MATSSKDKIRVNNPCPVLLTRMTKDGKNYFCKSCSKTIIDFRYKTMDEMRCSINKDTCGIFTSDQLSQQQKMTLSRKVFFYFLTVFSFFGLSVRPLNAQITRTAKDTVSINIKTQSDTVQTDKTVIKKNAPSTKNKGLFRKKKKYRVVGTPSF